MDDVVTNGWSCVCESGARGEGGLRLQLERANIRWTRVCCNKRFASNVAADNKLFLFTMAENGRLSGA